MGLISGILGNASTVDNDKIQKELVDVLVPNETVQAAFRVIRDLFVFTNKRMILVDKQGYTGKKVEYKSVPYKSIKYFSVETAGRFDMDAELKIWISNRPEPTISKTLKRGIDIVSLQKTLAYYVMG
ncbi:MAG: PH domain-containing protein [Chloroflexota bacterium]